MVVGFDREAGGLVRLHLRLTPAVARWSAAGVGVSSSYRDGEALGKWDDAKWRSLVRVP